MWIAWLRVLDPAERGVEFTCDDHDGDGRPELVLTSTLVSGWTGRRMWIFDGGNLGKPIELTARKVFAVRDPLTNRALFVSQSAFNATGGGKATYLATVIGSEFRVIALRPGAPPRTAIVQTGKSAW